MTIKVIQWSSGNVGRHVVTAVQQRPGMKLVGMYVYGEAKAGRDAGELAGIGPIGVKATRDVEKILKMKADVVVHSPLPSLVYGDDPEADVDTFCRLLAAGKNVITTVGYLYPKVHGPALVRRLQAACRKGNSSFHSTGLNPGWMGDLLPLTMSALCNRIDEVHVLEISNFQHYPSPEIMFDMMGFGKTPARFRKDSARYSHWLTSLFRESVQLVADGLQIPIDDIKAKTTRVLAERDLETAAGTVKQGSVAGQHWEWSGMLRGRKVIRHETVWRMHESVAPDWARGNHSVTLRGEPNMRIDMRPDWIDGGLLSTAMHAVNAIPYVCEAEPGIRTLLDLPWMMGRGLHPRDKSGKNAKRTLKTPLKKTQGAQP